MRGSNDRHPVALARRVSLWPRVTLIFVLACLGVVLSSQPQPAEAYDVCPDPDHPCTHEYMADQAKELYTNPELDQFYSSQVRVGVGHEDQVDHVFSYRWVEKALVTITHFWEADFGPDDPVDNLLGDFPNALEKVRALWALALGAYGKGDKALAYHWLGHVVHHIGDQTIPTHTHDDMHGPDILDDDSYEEWMSIPGGGGLPLNGVLSQSEKDTLKAAGPLPIPASEPDKLHWLMYTSNQIADFFPSDDEEGDIFDPLGLVTAELANMNATIIKPLIKLDLIDNDFGDAIPPGAGNNNDDGDLGVIRHYSYLRGIRAIAATYKLFEETVRNTISAVVVIEKVEELDDHDFACAPIPVPPFRACAETSDPDFFSRVSINGRVGVNRGDELEDGPETIYPGWAYGNTAGTTGSIPVWIEIWDHDGGGEDLITLAGKDDLSNITAGPGRRLDLNVDLAKCLTGAEGAITGGLTGKCRQSLATTVSADDSDDEDGIARVTFQIFLSKSPPTADAGGPHTTPEGTDVTLDAGGSTDPDNDITSYTWDLDGDGDCDDATGKTTTYSAVGQDGVTTVKVCVTDATGMTDGDTTTVTVTNVTPTISLNSDSPNEENAVTTVTGTVSDFGWLETLSATISWGDGSSTQALTGTLENTRPDATFSFNATHTYGDNGSFTVQVCARDDDTTPCQSIAVQSDNVKPTAAIDLTGAVSVNGTQTFIVHAGDALNLKGRSVDPGSDDLTLGWDFGDGSTKPSTLYMVNPPNLDPASSPSSQPRDITETQSHAYIEACVYQLKFSSKDDDGGAKETSANVIIVANGADTGNSGFWRHQFRTYNTGHGEPAYHEDELDCYLAIAHYMSRVFNEARSANTFEEAEDVLWTNATSDMTELLDQQLLSVWLNFANGSIEFGQLVDTNGDNTPDTPFLTAVAGAETVRLNPAATRQQLEAQKTILERMN